MSETDKTQGAGRQQYDMLFQGNTQKDTKREKALAIAHTIRQFEIDLYWKRAGYFWTILAVAFAGFFAALKTGTEVGAAFVSDLGIVVNLALYLVNRGSARWQQNWEFHVDMLEDDVTGPIYKTHFSTKIHRFWDLPGAYGYSPTRLNSIISIFTFIAWFSLNIIALERAFESPELSRLDAWFILTASFSAIVACAALLYYGQSRSRSNDRILEFSTRVFD